MVPVLKDNTPEATAKGVGYFLITLDTGSIPVIDRHLHIVEIALCIIVEEKTT